MKKLISLMLVVLFTCSFCTAFADGEPDFSSMNSQEWFTYEWHMDESTVVTDITSYDVECVRNVLIPIHTTGFLECVMGASDLPEEDRLGFSYGGIVASLAADRYYGNKNASEVVEAYVPDEIDAVSSDIDIYLAVYSVTPGEITNENFPPTFFAVGNDDSVKDWVMRCFDLVREKGIRYEIHTFAGVAHGIGVGKHASGVVYENAALWPVLADAFMQNVYAAK